MDGSDETTRFEALVGSMPREALAVVADLLSAAGGASGRALARRLRDKAGFVLESVMPDGRRKGLFASIPPFQRPSRKLSAPNLATCAQIAPEDVAAWFGPGGAFSKTLPGYESRPEQMRMAAAVAKAFNEGRHLLVEAGTGVGKTMAYLVPAVLWAVANKAPVVVCTSTKNLQEQIFRKDLPLLASMLSSPVRFALVKGRGNYLCLSRLERLLERREAELPQEAFTALARAVVWAFSTKSGDLSEFDPGPGGAAMLGPDRICSSGDECRGRGCPYRASCFMQKARAAALSSDLVVTNHAVFFSEPDDESIALPKAAQVVFDEAHNLESAATEHFAMEATPQSLRRLLRRAFVRRPSGGRSKTPDASSSGVFADAEKFLVGGALPPGGAAMRQALFELANKGKEGAVAAQKAVREWCRALGAVPRPDETARRLTPQVLSSPAWIASIPALERLQDALFALSKTASALATGFLPPDDPAAGPAAAGRNGGGDAAAELARRLSAFDAEVQGALQAIDFISEADDEDWVFWIESAPSPRGATRGSAEAGLKAAPVDISGFLASTLFEKRDSVILCSATLRTGGSMEWMAGRLGLDKLDGGRVAEDVEGSPFDYGSQCIAAVPMFLPKQNPSPSGGAESEEFISAFSSMVIRLAEKFGGRTLVLFTSHRMLRTVAVRLRALCTDGRGFRILAQGEGVPREELTGLFRDGDAPSILLGADSFWEGVDLIGDALRCVVMAKLPFASPGEPLVEARGERVERNGGSRFSDWALPVAVIKFRQGFGRLIRHKTDRGAVVLADSRIFDKNYGAIFRRALPAAPARFDSEDEFYEAVSGFAR